MLLRMSVKAFLEKIIVIIVSQPSKCLKLMTFHCKTNVFHNVFKVWMNCENTMEKLWKSSSTILSLFHDMELKLNVELV